MDQNQAMIKGQGLNDVTVTLLGLSLEYHGSNSGGLRSNKLDWSEVGFMPKVTTDDDGLNILKSPILQYP